MRRKAKRQSPLKHKSLKLQPIQLPRQQNQTDDTRKHRGRCEAVTVERRAEKETYV